MEARLACSSLACAGRCTGRSATHATWTACTAPRAIHPPCAQRAGHLPAAAGQAPLAAQPQQHFTPPHSLLPPLRSVLAIFPLQDLLPLSQCLPGRPATEEQVREGRRPRPAPSAAWTSLQCCGGSSAAAVGPPARAVLLKPPRLPPDERCLALHNTEARLSVNFFLPPLGTAADQRALQPTALLAVPPARDPGAGGGGRRPALPAGRHAAGEPSVCSAVSFCWLVWVLLRAPTCAARHAAGGRGC